VAAPIRRRTSSGSEHAAGHSGHGVDTRGQSRTVLTDDGTDVHSTHAPAFQSPPSGSGTLRVSLSFPRLRRFVFFVPSDTGCWQISGEVRDMVARHGPCSLADDGTDVHSTR